MTDYINKVDLLLALADLPNEAGKREVLRVVYDMPVVKEVLWGDISIDLSSVNDHLVILSDLEEGIE